MQFDRFFQQPRNLVSIMLLCVLVMTDTALAGPLRDYLSRNRESKNAEVLKLISGGMERTYILHAPGMDDTHRRPLVIVLHGTYGTGKKMQKGLGFDDHARRHGFIVAYPDAYRDPGRRQTTRWNDGRGVLASTDLAVDDVAFIADMIADISRSHPVDAKRIFVTGASNGGIMTYRLGCELRGKIRAIAPVIGNVAAPLSASCRPQAGLSVLSINGDRDPYIPLEGGEVCKGISKRLCEGGYVLSREKSLAYFSGANGCKASPVSRKRPPKAQDGTWVEELDYAGCDNKTTVRSLIVHGMGHVWSPRSGQGAKSGPTTRNLDATREIVEFFMGFE